MYTVAVYSWSIANNYVLEVYCRSHSLYLQRELLVGTLEAPHGVRQMNGVPQSGADRCATAESLVRAYCSNEFTVTEDLFSMLSMSPPS